MSYNSENFLLLATPFLIILHDLFRVEFISMIDDRAFYLLVILYGAITLNLYSIYPKKNKIRYALITSIPFAVALQYYVSIITDYNLANLVSLSILITIFSKYARIPYESHKELKLYITSLVMITFTSIYLNIGNIPFIILGPIWENILVKNVCGSLEESPECITLASLNASLLYNYNYMFVLYASLASSLKQVFRYKHSSYIFIVDSIIRLSIIWVVNNAI